VTLARVPTVYWDSCVWIGLINQEPEKVESIAGVLAAARRGEVQIVTSSFTLCEVVSRKCDGEKKEITADEDDAFAELLKADFVTVVTADWDAGMKARELYRAFRSQGLKKPQDALHLATAVLESVDVMHTFDDDDFLKLDGKVSRADGIALAIRLPPEPPPPAEVHPDLFNVV